jgi:hypothetical protein
VLLPDIADRDVPVVDPWFRHISVHYARKDIGESDGSARSVNEMLADAFNNPRLERFHLFEIAEGDCREVRLFPHHRSGRRRNVSDNNSSVSINRVSR